MDKAFKTDKTFKLSSVSEFCDFFGVETLHPLISVANFEDYGTYSEGTMNAGGYCIMYKELHCGEMKYGRSKYDYQAGTLLFISPGQLVGIKGRQDPDAPKYKGHVLIFHPDFLYGTPLARAMKDYSFFSYDANEALHMSEKEKKIILGCIEEIKTELANNIDRHTKQIVTSYLGTMLNHCVRFYERQFITREVSNRGIMGKLETLLNDYFDNNRQEEQGLPSVQYCARELCLSPNYFGDLIKKETGNTATEYIQRFVIERAKILLAEGELNISETAYELGFKYPHHLTRVFKKVTGRTPYEYLSSCN